MGRIKSTIIDLASGALGSGANAWRRANYLVAAALVALGLLYVGQAWSPSSYGHVLQQAEATDTGVVWGQPRHIRSDEWAVTTPLTQATVRNNFQRYNLTSAYGEDLRINYSMPLLDWGLIFKPTHWLYQLAPAPYAFSWHYWAMFAIFLFGYAYLFRIARASPLEAFLLSLGLYFSGFVQFFWNSNTSLFSYFPWLIVIAASSLKTWVRGLLFYWIGTCWLIGNFYPPLFISLTLVGAVLVWAYRPDLLTRRTIITFALATLAACATSCLYLWDYLFQAAQTSYPGQRTSVAGYYPWHLFLSQFWPSVLFDENFNSNVSYTNVTGVGVAGLYWSLMGICFCNWSLLGIKKLWGDRSFRALLVGQAVAMSWMLLPVPSLVGQITLLNRVPPERMVFAAGLLLMLVIFHIFKCLGVAKNFLVVRCIVYCGVVTSGWLAYGHWITPAFGAELHMTELIAPALVWIALALSCGLGYELGTALLCAGVLANALVFGRFNPLQSAHPIFEEPRHPLAMTLRSHVDAEGILPVQQDGLIGATLNGMGFKAIAHLNATPQWQFWEMRLSNFAEDHQKIMNRYAHIRLTTSDALELLENDQVGVPSKYFRNQPSATTSSRAPRHKLAKDGLVEGYVFKDNKLTITGWFPVSHELRAQEYLAVSEFTTTSVRKIVVSNKERWDRVKLTGQAGQLLSGFVITIYFNDRSFEHQPICIFSRSRGTQEWYRLSTPQGTLGCVTH